jgi:DNA-binding NarL/FixJ family response regulator
LSRTGNPAVDAGKLRVVIVEDSVLIRARLAEVLGEIPGLEIAGEAETEVDALALLRQGGWDAAILDLQLRQGTGLGVLKALPRANRPPGAKVIVFTNYSFPQYRARSLALEADFFFDKSRDFERVGEVLATLAAESPPGPG